MTTHEALAHTLIRSAGYRALGRIISSRSARLLQQQQSPPAAGGVPTPPRRDPTPPRRAPTPPRRVHTPAAPPSHVGDPGGATSDAPPKRPRVTAPAPPAVAARSTDGPSPENKSKRQRAAAPAPPAAGAPITDEESPETKARDFFAILMERTTAPVPAAQKERAQLEEFKRVLSHCLWVFSAETHDEYERFHAKLMDGAANLNVTLNSRASNWQREASIDVCMNTMCRMYDDSWRTAAKELVRRLIDGGVSSPAANALAKVGAVRGVHAVLSYLSLAWKQQARAYEIGFVDFYGLVGVWLAFELAVQAALLSPLQLLPPLGAILQMISRSPMNAFRYVYDNLRGPTDLTQWNVLLRMLKAFEGLADDHKSAIPRALAMMKDILATAPNIPTEWPHAGPEKDPPTVANRKERVRDVLLVGLRQAP